MLDFVGSLAAIRRGALSRAISKPIIGSCITAGGKVTRVNCSGPVWESGSASPCESVAVAMNCSELFLECAPVQLAHPFRARGVRSPCARRRHSWDARSALPPRARAAHPLTQLRSFPSGADSLRSTAAPFSAASAAPLDPAASPPHIHPHPLGTNWPYRKNRPGTDSHESSCLDWHFQP